MRKFLLLFITLTLFAACEDDNEILPSYIQDLAELVTDANGRATSIVFDNGEAKTLGNEISGLQSDTTYRIRAFYTEEDDKVWLTNYSSVLTMNVARYNAEYVQTDPVSVMACWQGCNYINLRLSITGTTSGVHYFAFHQTDYVYNDDGSRTLNVLLIHNQNNDPLYYSREAYLSLPLRPLDNILTAGRDSIRLTIETFDGERSYAFCQNNAL